MIAQREPAGEMVAFPPPPEELSLGTALNEPVVDTALENVVGVEKLPDDPSAQEPQEVVEDELVVLVVGSQDPQVAVVEGDPGFVGTTVTVV